MSVSATTGTLSAPTVESIRNPRRQSGYNHVGFNQESFRSEGLRPKPYQAVVYGGTRDKAGTKWKGPRRATAQEAAQDYIDFVTDRRITAAQPLVRADHSPKGKRPRLPRTPEVEAALGVLRDVRGQQSGEPGYVYLIGEEYQYGTQSRYGKIGYSTKPEARVGELQAGNPRKLMLLGKVRGTKADEARIQQEHRGQNVLQEWFVLTPALIQAFAGNQARSA